MREIIQGRRRTARILVAPAILAAGITGFGVSAAGASTQTGAATGARPAAVTAQPDVWEDGGSYPTLYDCQQSGQEALGHGGAAQYRCDPVDYPDGQIQYWQLWLEY